MLICRQAALILGSLAGTFATLWSDTYTLVGNSPFVPTGFNPPSANLPSRQVNQQESRYAYHGVYQIGSTFYFNIFNQNENKGEWVRSDKANGSDVRILNYDLESDEVEIEVNGENISLTMVQPSDQPIPVQVKNTAAAPTPAVARPAAATQPTATNRPVRRRVIRPTTRTNPGTTAVRRPIVRQ